MPPPQQSRQFHLYLHLTYANHKYITHKMWRTVTTSYGVPLMILIHSAQTKKKLSILQHRLHMFLHVSPKITETSSYKKNKSFAGLSLPAKTKALPMDR